MGKKEKTGGAVEDSTSNGISEKGQVAVVSTLLSMLFVSFVLTRGGLS